MMKEQSDPNLLLCERSELQLSVCDEPHIAVGDVCSALLCLNTEGFQHKQLFKVTLKHLSLSPEVGSLPTPSACSCV